jgi:hypothetical protein
LFTQCLRRIDAEFTHCQQQSDGRCAVVTQILRIIISH